MTRHFGRASWRGALPLVLAMAVCGLPAEAAWAGTASAQFAVNVTLVPAGAAAAPQSGYCTTGPSSATSGAAVTVLCGSRTVVGIAAPGDAVPWTNLHGAAYRFVNLPESEVPGGRLLNGIDSYNVLGTVVSWRFISLASLDYLEMEVGW